MSTLTISDSTKPLESIYDIKENVVVKTVRLTINVFTNIIMSLAVFVSLLFACNSKKITVFHLHIILCVLGYQFLMHQGILVLSKYNSWSMYLNRSHKRNLHFIFQFLAFVLVVVGSSVIMKVEENHFNSAHGILGILALIICIMSIINGVLANYAHKLLKTHVPLIKFIHYLSGVLTLLLSAASLTTGFEEVSFRKWIKNDDAVAALIFISWIFTLAVALDFWVLSGQRLRSML